ncbi:DUF6999 family protein [Zavarzinia sp. CC-PAN008]|uniref:DUF6999 family protein n=1 Tax=Zavarzinia sp. CC-PAN008 TaxID=3243332 RepID=UPI003F747290
MERFSPTLTADPPEAAFPPDLDPARLDMRDPDPWLALYLDTSIPIDPQAKAALIRCMRSRSRKSLLPFLRPLARTFIVLNTVVRTLLMDRWHSSKVLHRLIVWGLGRFVSPDANFLVVRHFHLGTELLQFVKDNVPGAEAVETTPLRPRTLDDLRDDVFLVHDLNLFNFVIQLGALLRREGRDIVPPERVNYAAITDGPQDIAPMPDGRLNVIDVQSGIEAYTPLYQLFLTDADFWRAANSLQLDETIGIYIAKILGSPYHLFFANNKHPIVPQSTLRAGFRLMLHGLAVEQLHYHLRQRKRAALAHEAAPAVI